jgi:ABC-type bacteriocin/lantibiotic exporter with double-glycine peptidase domain
MSVWKVPVVSQKTAKLCWEACSRMMWEWRFKSDKGYATKAKGCATLDKGLTEDEMDHFYKLLALRSLPSPVAANLRHALKWSPVIITSIQQSQGHAMVVAGFTHSKYIVVNPCAVESVDFDEEADSASCQAKSLELSPSTVEGSLGKYIWYW